MKCPFCKSHEIEPSKVKGYYSCPGCGLVFTEEVNDDPELKCKYDVEFMRSKQIESPDVFEKAKNKFDNGRFTVVGIKPQRGDYSLFFGQNFFVLKRKN